MRKRTRARELALQFLYQVDVGGEDTLLQINDFLTNETKDRDVQRFAVELIQGTWKTRNESDNLIKKIARNWDIHRMAVIDRNILRMAVYEMQMGRGTPPKVVINEAIELGKRFSTQHSGKFINGILDRVKEAFESGKIAGMMAAPPAGGSASTAAADLPIDDDAEEEGATPANTDRDDPESDDAVTLRNDSQN